MELSVRFYLALLVAVAIGRLVELARSRRNRQKLTASGSAKEPEPGYKWMVALHTAFLLGCALEVILLRRHWIPFLGWTALVLFMVANGVRWWVIATLGDRWNVEVMLASRLGVVNTGPYRLVRHPNYTAVFVEMLALPLIHTAWITAWVGGMLHVIVLRNRVQLEESVMKRDAAWWAAFEDKPRFIPR